MQNNVHKGLILQSLLMIQKEIIVLHVDEGGMHLKSIVDSVLFFLEFSLECFGIILYDHCELSCSLLCLHSLLIGLAGLNKIHLKDSFFSNFSSCKCKRKKRRVLIAPAILPSYPTRSLFKPA